jgi:hypothetical protein
MTDIKTHTKKVLIMIVFLAIIVGCSKRGEPIVTQVVNQNILLDTETIPSKETVVQETKPVIQSPTLIISPSASWTPFVTKTLKIEDTPVAVTPKMDLSSTALPKIPTQNLEKAIQGYFLDNNGCSLPCWWGIEVGKTPWVNAVYWLDQLNIQTSTSEDEYIINGNVYPVIKNGYLYESGDKYFSWLMSNVDKTVAEITIGTNYSEQFGLSSLLNTIGVPERTYLSTADDVPGYPQTEPYLPFDIILHYQEKHMIVLYHLEGQNDDKNITGCFDNQKIVVWLWAPNILPSNIERYILNVAGGGGYDGASEYLRDLESVTSFTQEEFAEFYRVNGDVCLSTPSDYWR